MAAASSTGNGGGSDISSTRRRGSGVRRCADAKKYTDSGTLASAFSPNYSLQLEGPREDSSAAMLVDQEEDRGSADGSGGGEISFRRSRLFSDPVDSRDVFLDPTYGAAVSSARGITMGVVHGSVRAKTQAPTCSSASAGRFTRLSHGNSSMPNLAAAVEAPVESANELLANILPQREFRATSSAARATLIVARNSLEVDKRAKSGVSSAESTAAVSNGRQLGWMADIPGRQTETRSIPADFFMKNTEAAAASASTMSHKGAVAEAVTFSTAVSPSKINCLASATTEEGGNATAAPVQPVTNEAWIALLSPLLEKSPPGTHPEDLLHKILNERGYSTEMAAGKETEFYCSPEPARVAAYDKAILKAVLDEDEAALERMRTAGRRMDACNRFGDSVLHMACRRGRASALRYFLSVCGPGGVLLSDDFGRTVMHDACWTATPRFDVASAVLDVDTRLLRMLDSRGSSPLQYVPQDQWPLWCAFFEFRKEIYWPQLAPGEQDIAGHIPLRNKSAASSVSA